jgi:branched-chain amino acid transport system permease protein
MSLSLIAQAVLSGVTNGVIYALIGMGLAVIFKGSRVVNAAQGEFALIGAVVAVFAMKGAGFSYPAAFLGGALAGMVAGIAVDVLFVRPMIRRNAEEDAFLLLTVGLAFTLSAAVLFFGGRGYFSLPTIGPDGVAIVLDATIRYHAIWVIVIAAAIVVALIPISYYMGLVFTLKGFCAAMIGGLTNPMGAIVGGLVLGLLESLAVVFVASAYKDAVALGALLAIMMLAPHGIFGGGGRKGG